MNSKICDELIVLFCFFEGIERFQCSMNSFGVGMIVVIGEDARFMGLVVIMAYADKDDKYGAEVVQGCGSIVLVEG